MEAERSALSGSDLDPDFISPSVGQVLRALDFIVPLLEDMELPWVITGGFACHIYGVERALSDIDIDIHCAHDDAEFVSLMETLEPYITQPLEHYVDAHYNNYNAEATIEGVVFDFCPGDDLRLFDPVTHDYEYAYRDGFPVPVITSFDGFNLPLLPKELIIVQKSLLKRPIDLRDIAALQRLT